jgi:hypothetical protein
MLPRISGWTFLERYQARTGGARAFRPKPCDLQELAVQVGAAAS